MLVVAVPVQAVAPLRAAPLVVLPPIQLEGQVVGEGVGIGADVVILHQGFDDRPHGGRCLGGHQAHVFGVLGPVPPVLGRQAVTLSAVGAATSSR